MNAPTSLAALTDASPGILEFVIAGLRDLGPPAWPAVSDATGVSVHTIRKIVYGDRKNPGIDLVQPLYSYLRKPPEQQPGAQPQ